ncbi:MAG: hypothetical protein ACYCZ6_17730 [Polaromonas sp.]
MEQFELVRLMQEVPVRQVFEEVGFTLDRPDGECMSWRSQCEGIAIQYDVGPGMFSGWQGAAMSFGKRTALFGELWFATSMVRGEVLLRLASVWKEAFPRAALPAELREADTYEEFKRGRSTVNPGAPHIAADSKFLRFIVGQIRQRLSSATPARVTFALVPGQLEIRVASTVMHCPASGKWFGEASVDLAELMAAIPHRFNYRSTKVEFDNGSLKIEGTPVAADWIETAV